jgi:hypothetical protein
LPLAPDPSQHLVLDLDEVPGIEKLVGEKQFVGDLFGVGIHSTVLAKGAIFGIGVALFGHEEVFLQYGCKYNYAPIEV